jgi:hypothetical protein
MVESRWVRWVGPCVIALGAVGFIAATTLGAGARPWAPRACAGPPVDRMAAAREPDHTSQEDLRATPWFQVDPLLDADGALRAQQLSVGLVGERTAQRLDLPAESFAAGPFGRVILVGSDDGATSRLAAIDIANGCSWAIGHERSVIRRATIDPTGSGIYEMRVDRVSRADLGIWWRPLDGRGPGRRILAPIASDGRFGRTYSTEFTWDVAGDRLAIQSCGEVACRTRILSPRDGSVATLDAPDLGPLVGLDGDRVVTYGACRGLPCPIVSTDLRAGDRRVLAPAAGVAIVVRTKDGPRLVHEIATTTGRGLRSIALDGSGAFGLGSIPNGLDLLAGPIRAGAATRLPPGWVLLAQDGRLPANDPAQRAQLRRIPDGLAVPLDEAPR